tara:strand:- start:1115 stop:1474 length:360 start_codon:yes stop_codon:yes gene_type:complete
MPKVKAEAPVELFTETPKPESGLNINIILLVVICLVVLIMGYVMYKMFTRLNSMTVDLNQIKEFGPQIIHVQNPPTEETKTNVELPDDKLKTIKEIPEEPLEEPLEEIPEVKTFDVDKD